MIPPMNTMRPVGSMGADTPLAVFSEKNQSLFSYFKQLFAQVTNPAIDPVREELVMSLMTFIGNPGNILSETPQNSSLIKLSHPILSNDDLNRLRYLDREGFRAATLPMGLRQELTKSQPAGLAIENYIKALCKGLLKIMSKMGISTLRSYRSAQVFEAIGLKSSLVEKYFPRTGSRIEGIGLDEIAAEANARHEQAFNKAPDVSAILPGGGHYRLRKDGERHLLNPESITLLQRAVRENDRRMYERYTKLINDQSEKLATCGECSGSKRPGLFLWMKWNPPRKS